MIPWHGDALYRFSRAASVSSDSSGERPLATSSESREILTRTPSPRGVSFDLSVADSGTGKRKVGERASGLLAATQLTLDPSTGTVPCSPMRAQLRADLADLSFPLLTTIARGESWTDSVSNEACVSGIPGTAQTRRQFLVMGDTTFGSMAAVIVERRDSVSLSGDGALDRHAITLAAHGAGGARIYISVPEGKVLRLERELLLKIDVTSGSRTRTFVQNSTSVAELDR